MKPALSEAVSTSVATVLRAPLRKGYFGERCFFKDSIKTGFFLVLVPNLSSKLSIKNSIEHKQVSPIKDQHTLRRNWWLSIGWYFVARHCGTSIFKWHSTPDGDSITSPNLFPIGAPFPFDGRRLEKRAPKARCLSIQLVFLISFPIGIPFLIMIHSQLVLSSHFTARGSCQQK